jgi:hypothetical protein
METLLTDPEMASETQLTRQGFAKHGEIEPFLSSHLR